MCILNFLIRINVSMKKPLLLLIIGIYCFTGFSQALDFTAIQASIDFSELQQFAAMAGDNIAIISLDCGSAERLGRNKDELLANRPKMLRAISANSGPR